MHIEHTSLFYNIHCQFQYLVKYKVRKNKFGMNQLFFRKTLLDYIHYMPDVQYEFESNYMSEITTISLKVKLNAYTCLLERIKTGKYTRSAELKHVESLMQLKSKNLEKIDTICLEISKFNKSLNILNDYVQHGISENATEKYPLQQNDLIFLTCKQSHEMDKKLIVKLKNMITQLNLENNARLINNEDLVTKNKIRKNYLMITNSQYKENIIYVTNHDQSIINVHNALKHIFEIDNVFLNYNKDLRARIHFLANLLLMCKSLYSTVFAKATKGLVKFSTEIMGHANAMYSIKFVDEIIISKIHMENIDLNALAAETDVTTLSTTEIGGFTYEIKNVRHYEGITASHKHKMAKLFVALASALKCGCNIIVIDDIHGIRHYFEEFVNVFELEVFNTLQVICCRPNIL